MISILVDGITYQFTGHAIKRMQENGITPEMVQAVMLDPDVYEQSKSSPYMIYAKYLYQQRIVVQTAVDETNRMIVTVYALDRS